MAITTADKLKAAITTNVDIALDNTLEFLKSDTWGRNEYSGTFIADMKDILIQLMGIKSKLE